ncbi:MAG: hypothetical protein WBC04_08095 [Candidatus Acidiferrales bacterium]
MRSWDVVGDHERRRVRLVARWRLLSIEGGETVEKQLANVGESDSVAAADAFAGELLEEVAEEEVDEAAVASGVEVPAGLGGRLPSASLGRKGFKRREMAEGVQGTPLCFL